MNNSEKQQSEKHAVERPRQYFNVLWRFGSNHSVISESGYRIRPAIDETKIYFGVRDGSFIALDQLNGRVVWKFSVRSIIKNGGVFSTPVIHNGNVYFGAGDKNIYCLDAQTGRRIWVSLEADWKGSTLAIDPISGSVFVTLESGIIHKKSAVYALDWKTGATKWKHAIGAMPQSAIMTIPEQERLIIENIHGVCALDTHSGKVLWTRRMEGGVNDTFFFDRDRSWIFWNSSSGSMHALAALDGEIQFHVNNTQGISSPPFIFDNHIVFSSLSRNVECLDVTSKKIRWKFETHSKTISPPVIIERSVFTGGNDGMLYEIDLYTGQCLSETKIANAITSATLYDPTSRRFFFSVGAERLYCICRQMTVYFFYDL